MASAQDNFDRADVNPIGSPWALAWGDNPARIVSNAAAAPVTGALTVMLYGSSGLNPNQQSRVRLGTTSSSEIIFAGVRLSSASGGGGYFAEYIPQTGQVYLSRRVAGANTGLNGGAPVGTRTIATGNWLVLDSTNVGSDTRLRVYDYDGTTFTQIGADVTDLDANDVETGDPGFGINNQNVNATRLSEWYAIDDAGASPTINAPATIAQGDAVAATVTDAPAANRSIALINGAVSIAQTVTGTDGSATFTANFERAAPLTSIRRGVTATARITNTSNSQTGDDTFTTASPAGQTYVDLTSVNTTADYRISSVTDLAVGDQLQFRGRGGDALPNGFAAYADGTFGFTGGFPALPFEVRVFDNADNTLGDWVEIKFSSAGAAIGVRRHTRRYRGAGNWRS